MRLDPLTLVLAALIAGRLAAPSPAQAQDSPRPMTVEDVLRLKSVADPQISPDGRWVVYVVTAADLEENESNSDIWLVPTGGGEPYPLTRGPKRDNSPRWSPDGTWIAFLSNRDEKTQVYGIDVRGGEAWPVTDWEPGVGEFELSPDGRRIAFAASPKQSEEEKEREKLRGRPIVWDSVYSTAWSYLWVAELDETRRAGEVRRSSPDTLHVSDFVWSPDSRSLAWSARPSPVLRTWRLADVFVQDTPAAEPRRVTRMPGGEGVVAWTQELGLLVGGTGHELGTFNVELWRAPLGGGEPLSLTDSLDEHAGYVDATDESLLIEASEGALERLYRIPLRQGRSSGSPRPVSDDEMYYHSFSVSEDGGTIAFIAEGPTMPPDVYVSSTRNFAPRRLTTVNPQVEDFSLGEHRVVSWSSAADGEEIEGVLTLPVGYEEGERVPLLLVIHGGPAGVSSNRFTAARGAYPVQVFAGLGYAVLQPNYRGSTGYGERFRGLNRGDISGSDWVDIDSGVDHLIDLGIADPERLGVMGWSFGGHHTFWGITQTDRFAAASAGAGANDLISMYSQTDIPEFYHTYLGPKPWEDFELYEQRSAYRYVDRVTTPLLIQVGEADERVPAEQSIQFFEAVRALGKAPVKLVVYPGEPHGIRSPRHRRDLMQRNVEWFTRWIPVEGAAATNDR